MFVLALLLSASAAEDVDLQPVAAALAGPAGCFDLPYVASGTGTFGPVTQRGTARFEDHQWTMAHLDWGHRLEAIGTSFLLSNIRPAPLHDAPYGLVSGRVRVLGRRGRPVPIVATAEARDQGAERIVTYTAAAPAADWEATVEVVVDAAGGALRSVSLQQSAEGWVVRRAAKIGPSGLPTREVIDQTPPTDRYGRGAPRVHLVYEVGAPCPCAP